MLRARGDLVVVAGLGAPAYDLAACGDGALNFSLWGAMGGDDLYRRAEISFAVVKILPEDLPRVLPPRDGAFLTQRLRAELIGEERALEG